ncbi:MAG TPA: AMP-binding protein [Jatrophihabitans sp.]|nr:AMP-binding protein [Jatrophihabitans sp.]
MNESPRNPAGLLRAAAAVTPDRRALVAGQARWTYAEWDSRVSRAANALLARGLAAGDRVTVQLPTGTDFTLGYLGALRAGLVPVPVDPAYTAAEVEHIRTDARAALHIGADSVALLHSGESAADPGQERGGEDLAVMLYTSGTSALAKGAMLSGRALLANLDQLAAVTPPLLGAADVLFLPLPLTHAFGLNAGLGMALRVGATLVLADRFEPAATLATMAAEQVTAVLGVPGLFAAWLADPGLTAGFAGVRFALSGSTTLPQGVVDGYAAAGVVLHNGYGLTEAAPVVTINALGAGRDAPTPGSIGASLPGVEVQLRDNDGDQVDEGDPGRIFVRGANLFSGYWPDGAGGPDADGWFGTGDIAVADDAGELRLVGRSTDLVIVNGFNVYPAEVEAALAAQPGVAEVAVVGVADPTTGEAVHAYVVAAAGVVLDPARLLAGAATSLARFKLPRAIDVVPALPRTVTGKIRKWQLDRAGG